MLAHADGGGVLYLDASAAEADVTRLVTDSHRPARRLQPAQPAARRPPRLRPAVAGRRGRARRPRHRARACRRTTHPLGHEWALDSGAEAHVTVATVDGPVDAAQTAARETSGLAATVCATDEAAATAFVDAYTGTGVFWNATTRLLDGYKLLGLPETGINVDHTPGPRGPVTYVDLSLRQFVVLPARTARAVAPNRARNARLKCDASTNPHENAMSPIVRCAQRRVDEVGVHAVEALRPDPLRDRARPGRRRRGAACSPRRAARPRSRPR